MPITLGLANFSMWHAVGQAL